MNKLHWTLVSLILLIIILFAISFTTGARFIFPKIPTSTCHAIEGIVCDINGKEFTSACEAESRGLSADKNEYNKDFCTLSKTTTDTGKSDWRTYSHDGIQFDYPTTWKLNEEKIVTEYSKDTKWYRADFGAKDGSANLRYESNPDGYGPFGWKKIYTLTISEDGTIKIAHTETTDPGEIPSKTLDYALKLNYKGATYLWQFTSNNIDDEEIFQQFLKSITLQDISKIGCMGETITSTHYAFCLPKNQTWKRENGQIDLTDTETEDTISIIEVNGNSYTDKDSKFGDITISYNIEDKAWESSIPMKTLITSKGIEVFTGTRRWLTYIVPIAPDRIIILNSTGGGYTDPLKELIETFVIEK